MTFYFPDVDIRGPSRPACIKPLDVSAAGCGLILPEGQTRQDNIFPSLNNGIGKHLPRDDGKPALYLLRGRLQANCGSILAPFSVFPGWGVGRPSVWFICFRGLLGTNVITGPMHINIPK